MNQQNQFLNKTKSRSSQQNENKSFKRFGSSLTAKSGYVSQSYQFQYKRPVFQSSSNNEFGKLPNDLHSSQFQLNLPEKVEKRPVFRITSVSQNNMYTQKTQSNTSEGEEPTEENNVRKSHFQYEMVIGKGGFGKVWIVNQKKSKKYFALKEMGKAKIISKRSVHSVMNERTLLHQITHAFIVNMKYAFQDRDCLYLVMDLLTGGDLRFHICVYRKFSEEQAKFFIACILAGLEYLHENSIIHRDIKPENLVFEENGYLRITDLGIARKWNPDNAKETSGTPGYMAPEVMCRQNHNIEVDYFAMGVICYECMMGKRPYLGRSRKEIRDQILAKQVKITMEDIPRGWSVEAADFANRLIQRKPARRLGVNGPSEIKAHPWLRGFPWDKQAKKQIEPPFKPNTKNVFEYAKNISEEDTNPDINLENNMILRKKETQDMFSGYYYEVKQSTTRPVSRRVSKTNSSNIKIRSLNSSSYMQENNH